MTSVSTTTKTVGGGGEPTPDPAPTNPANISDYSYLGCFTSSSDFDTFKQVQHSQDMTLERCIKLCDGKTYAGVVDGECSCAENLDPDTRAASSNDKCSLPCPGDDKEVCGGDDHLLTVYANVRDEEHPQPPPMAAPMTQAANERFVATVTKCPKEGSPVQTRLPAGTGLLPGGNSTVRPPVSGVVERNPPSKMSIIAGVVAMGVMMVM